VRYQPAVAHYAGSGLTASGMSDAPGGGLLSMHFAVVCMRVSWAAGWSPSGLFTCDDMVTFVVTCAARRPEQVAAAPARSAPFEGASVPRRLTSLSEHPALAPRRGPAAPAGRPCRPVPPAPGPRPCALGLVRLHGGQLLGQGCRMPAGRRETLIEHAPGSNPFTGMQRMRGGRLTRARARAAGERASELPNTSRIGAPRAPAAAWRTQMPRRRPAGAPGARAPPAASCWPCSRRSRLPL